MRHRLRVLRFMLAGLSGVCTGAMMFGILMHAIIGLSDDGCDWIGEHCQTANGLPRTPALSPGWALALGLVALGASVFAGGGVAIALGRHRRPSRQGVARDRATTEARVKPW